MLNNSGPNSFGPQDGIDPEHEHVSGFWQFKKPPGGDGVSLTDFCQIRLVTARLTANDIGGGLDGKPAFWASQQHPYFVTGPYNAYPFPPFDLKDHEPEESDNLLMLNN